MTGLRERLAELRAAFDLERMSEPGLSYYGPPSKTGLERIKRFRLLYGRLPASAALRDYEKKSLAAPQTAEPTEGGAK